MTAGIEKAYIYLEKGMRIVIYQILSLRGQKKRIKKIFYKSRLRSFQFLAQVARKKKLNDIDIIKNCYTREK